MSAADPKTVFSRIYETGAWSSAESVSGPGSELRQARNIIEEIPILLRELNVRSLLDLPCGDFNWMKLVNLAGIEYMGGDIVPDLVRINTEKYSAPGIRFQKMDLINGPLASFDAILCRDCLVHLPIAIIFTALKTVCDSGAHFFITTTYTNRRFVSNTEIEMGEWRRLDLQRSPFFFPPPLTFIVEGSTESGGLLSDKLLAVWSIAQIRGVLQR